MEEGGGVELSYMNENMEGTRIIKNGYIITRILHQIFMFHNKINSVAGLPLPSYWINGPTNKCKGILQAKLTSIFYSCHNIHVYSTSIIINEWTRKSMRGELGGR